MASEAFKILGQATSATSATALYTVPSGKSTVISTVAVCNQSGGSLTYKISTRPSGEALAAKHYIAYDSTVSANDTTFITVGITLQAGAILEVSSSSGSMSFTAYGSEITP